MEIEIQEENGKQILSKTQKQKIRRFVREVWTDEAGFYDHIEEVLGQIHYDPIHQDQRYNHIDHSLVHEKRLVLVFKTIPMETEEERRKKLKQKWKDAMETRRHAAAHVDPQEQMYQRLRQQLPEEQRKIIPKPSHVRENPDLYKQMMTMLPNQNPLCQYLSSFMG